MHSAKSASTNKTKPRAASGRIKLSRASNSPSAFSSRSGYSSWADLRNGCIRGVSREVFSELISMNELGQSIFEPALKARWCPHWASRGPPGARMRGPIPPRIYGPTLTGGSRRRNKFRAYRIASEEFFTTVCRKIFFTRNFIFLSFRGLAGFFCFCFFCPSPFDYFFVPRGYGRRSRKRQ